uniref:F-box protein 34 n=1 Tax=Salarias fasciatus TaxID=181472 RepID=A0A672I4B1_SALFA
MAAKTTCSWEENCSAKKRRRSCNSQNLQRDLRPRVTLPQAVELPVQRLEGERGEEEEQKVSVVEMVAVLEQRASELPEPKPLLTLQRSSTTITLSRAPLPEPRGEGPESLRVSDMVARLESECLRRSSEESLSRSNSLRRSVGRVLLANMEQSSAPSLPSPSPSPPAALSPSREPISCPETTSKESLASAQAPPPSDVYTDTEAPPFTEATPPEPEEAEPLPGLLFLSVPPLTRPRPSAVRPSSCDSSQSEQRRWQPRLVEEAGHPLTRTCASQDFLQLRERVQQLLQPRPFLWALPHHLLLHILHLLPTHSLAALKCTCSYFKVVMETYGVRPADSLWVSDPRYRDDPCKQCKRRYERGDVSLCRWHHKPFCQALPGGPGYWMCCRGNRRDAPGCNVGLHDNRWVPAFHSIHAPIRRSNNHDD